MPMSLAQFLNQDLDNLIMQNVEVCAFYKTCLIYIHQEMKNRNVEHFDFEPPTELKNGGFKMRITYGQGR